MAKIVVCNCHKFKGDLQKANLFIHLGKQGQEEEEVGGEGV